MPKPKVYSPPFYTATPDVGPYANPEDEWPGLREIRQRVTGSDYYKYLRSLPNYPEVHGWRPDYLKLYQDPVKYGGKEGFEPEPTVFSSTPAGYIRGNNGSSSPNATRYYYKNKVIDGRNYAPEDPYVSTGNLVRTLEAIRYAQTRGYAHKLPSQATDPYYLAARYLKEVRDEGGANYPNAHTYSTPARTDMEVARAAVTDRFGTDAGLSLAQLVEKGRVAGKLGIDFGKAWNGTGTADGGGSGNNYAYRMNHDFIPAAHHARNAEFIQFIRNQLDPKAPYTTPMTQDQYDRLKEIYGQRQRKARKGVEAKLDNNLLREIQWGLFGDNKYLGVPDEYSPEKAAARVPAPNYIKLTGLPNPVSGYNQGGIASLLKKPRR
jgi:hypothetical protein